MDDGLPLVVEILLEAVMAQHYVRVVPQEEHVSHLEGVILTVWQSMSCERVGKLLEEGRKLSFWGLTFVTLGDNSHLLEKHQKYLRIFRPCPPSSPLGNSIQKEFQLDSVFLHAGPVRGLCGACIHVPHPVCGVRRIFYLFPKSDAPLEEPTRRLFCSYYIYYPPPRA